MTTKKFEPVNYTHEMFAIDQGRKAYHNGNAIYENPHDHVKSVDMHRAWNSGWNDAQLRYELNQRGHQV